MDNFQTYSEFLNYIEINYDEEQQIIIENFISYYINEYRKFGKYNCNVQFEFVALLIAFDRRTAEFIPKSLKKLLLFIISYI